MEDRHFAAFAGIPVPERPSHEDLDEALRAQVAANIDGDQCVLLTFGELRQVAERIIELSAIVAQNALVAIPEPAVVMQPEPKSVIVDVPVTRNELSPERRAQMEAARARATKQGAIL